MVKTYKLQNLGCANCAAKMEKAINKLDGVNSATMNFFMQKLTVDVADDKLDEIMVEVKKICKKIEPDMKIIGA